MTADEPAWSRWWCKLLLVVRKFIKGTASLPASQLHVAGEWAWYASCQSAAPPTRTSTPAHLPHARIRAHPPPPPFASLSQRSTCIPLCCYCGCGQLARDARRRFAPGAMHNHNTTHRSTPCCCAHAILKATRLPSHSRRIAHGHGSLVVAGWPACRCRRATTNDSPAAARLAAPIAAVLYVHADCSTLAPPHGTRKQTNNRTRNHELVVKVGQARDESAAAPRAAE